MCENGERCQCYDDGYDDGFSDGQDSGFWEGEESGAYDLRREMSEWLMKKAKNFKDPVDLVDAFTLEFEIDFWR